MKNEDVALKLKCDGCGEIAEIRTSGPLTCDRCGGTSFKSGPFEEEEMAN